MILAHRVETSVARPPVVPLVRQHVVASARTAVERLRLSTEWSDQILISDLSDEPDLSDELASVYQRISEQDAERTPNVVLNFSSVTYLNSSNIAQMLRLRKRLTELDRRLMLCSLGDPVWSTMLLTGLDKVFSFAPDTGTAIAALQLDDAS